MLHSNVTNQALLAHFSTIC